MELNVFNYFKDLFSQLSSKLDTLIDSKKPEKESWKSEKLDQLGIALAKAQGEMTSADLNKSNPYFKSSYADITSIVSASRPYLSKYGLSVMQNIYEQTDGTSWLITMLLHGESDQWITSRKRIVPPKNDIQSYSSYVTYIKRISYASLIGVVSGDDDDDGEAAVATSRQAFSKGVALNTKYNPKESSFDVISKTQLEEIEYELNEYPDIAEMVLDGLKIQSLADIPASKYRASVERIREIKRARNG